MALLSYTNTVIVGPFLAWRKGPKMVKCLKGKGLSLRS